MFDPKIVNEDMTTLNGIFGVDDKRMGELVNQMREIALKYRESGRINLAKMIVETIPLCNTDEEILLCITVQVNYHMHISKSQERVNNILKSN